MHSIIMAILFAIKIYGNFFVSSARFLSDHYKQYNCMVNLETVPFSKHEQPRFGFRI